MMTQQRLTSKREQLHQIVDELLAIVSDGVQQQTPIHEVELKTFRTLLRAGQAVLQLLVDCLGDGDVGQGSLAVGPPTRRQSMTIATNEGRNQIARRWPPWGPCIVSIPFPAPRRRLSSRCFGIRTKRVPSHSALVRNIDGSGPS